MSESFRIVLYTLPALLVAVVVVVYFAQRTLRLSQQIQEYKFDAYRLELEKQIASLSQQLVLNEDRFKQVNHLLFSAQSRTPKEIESIRVGPNEFLLKMGINLDAEVQPDLVFVLMPFNPIFDDTYNAIKDVITAAGFRCTRGDTPLTSGEILPDIIQSIVKARLVIADITGRNPNVFYELGIAHAMDKQVLIISQVSQGIPFDVGSIRILIYENAKDLRERLSSWILHAFARLK